MFSNVNFDFSFVRLILNYFKYKFKVMNTKSLHNLHMMDKISNSTTNAQVYVLLFLESQSVIG